MANIGRHLTGKVVMIPGEISVPPSLPPIAALIEKENIKRTINKNK